MRNEDALVKQDPDTEAGLRRRSHKGLPVALRIIAPIVRLMSRALFKEHFRGSQNIPASGPAILVANHVSVVDPLAMAGYVWQAGRLPQFLIKDGVFKVAIVGSAMRVCRQVPVSRGSAHALKSLSAAIKILHEGGVIVVYPEGTVTRQKEFWPMRAKTGVGRIALELPDVPILPIWQDGAQKVWNHHTGKKSFFPRKITRIVAGEPLDLSAERALPEAVAMRAITDSIMNVITEGVGVLRNAAPPEVPPSLPTSEAL